jgi:hypothetical protein
MPLAIVQKISIGGAEFSASYLFMASVIAWVFLRSLLHLPKLGLGVIPATGVAPLILIAIMVVYGVFNGFDSRFVMAILLWAVFIYLGMLLPHIYLKRYSRLMTWLAVATAILGIVLYAVNIPLIDLESAGSDQYFVDSWGHYRASSLFLNPNSFGYFLLYYICVRLFGTNGSEKLSILGFLSVMAALVLSGSRSAWATCVFIITLRIIISLAPRLRTPLLFGVNIVLLTLLAILIALSDLFVAQDIRFEKWGFSLDIFSKSAEQIFTGIPEHIPLEKLGIYFSDNMFLTFLFKFGVVGFLVFAAFYIVIVYRSIVVLVQGAPELRPFAAYLLGASVMFFYSNFLYFYPMVLMHGVAAGVLLGRGSGLVIHSPNRFKAA